MLIIQYVLVEKEYRGMGAGKVLFDTLLQFAQEKTKKKGGVGAVFVMPCEVEHDFAEEVAGKSSEEEQAIWKLYYDKAVRFYERLGFIKIGSSRWYVMEVDRASDD